jgi:hypothetical protein
MKLSVVPVALAAALSGCAVVSPYERPYSAYSPGIATGYPDTVAPMTVAPAPVYVRPPVRFSFSLQYWSWHGGHRHHHGHRHGFKHRGFGGYGASLYRCCLELA